MPKEARTPEESHPESPARQGFFRRAANHQEQAMLVRCYWLLQTFALHVGGALAVCIATHTLLRTADDTSAVVLGLELLGIGCTAVLAFVYGLFCAHGDAKSVPFLLMRENTAECAAIVWALFFGLTIWAAVYDPMALPLTAASVLVALSWWRLARRTHSLVDRAVRTGFAVPTEGF